jgi:hypothetical protein
MDASLEDFWNGALRELGRANVDRKHAFRKVTLASVFKEKVNQRMVVHRRFYDNNTSLIFTDSRSKKVLQLESNPISSLLFYDDRKQLQISVAGLMSVHEGDELSEVEFKKLQSQADYSNFPPPGSAIAGAMEYKQDKPFFMVLKFNWLEVDVLQLSREGHKRAFMRRVEDQWEGNWIVP